MPRCDRCRKKVGLCGIKCKHCPHTFCTACMDLTVHECKGIEKFKTERKEILESKLMSAVCKPEKVAQI